MIRVLVVDDHALFRAGISARLAAERDMTVVGEAATGEEAVARARTLHPDVVLLDMLLPGRGGCDTIPELLRHSSDSRVIVVSSQASGGWVRRALGAGASGYVSKSATDGELLTAIRQVAGGDGYVEPKLGAKLVVDAAVPALEPLSDRERDVMPLLALGYTNGEIAERLFISVRTVDAHRAHIMLKLGLESRAELVMCALSNGIIGPESCPRQLRNSRTR
jgi:DNA-binding NarL/FixJ family response regulator